MEAVCVMLAGDNKCIERKFDQNGDGRVAEKTHRSMKVLARGEKTDCTPLLQQINRQPERASNLDHRTWHNNPKIQTTWLGCDH
jgi:hypothetical protein